MLDLIDQLVADFQDRALPRGTPRRARLAGLPGKADAVIGMRRSGKTWLLYEEILRLEAGGVPRAQMLYVNFEDERLAGLQVEHLQLIPEALLRRFPAVAHQRQHYFFDEIQNVSGWERFVRRLLDQGDVQVSLTGSSARLLGAELATSLRGRSLATELLPFGFDEALAHQGVGVPERWPPAAAERALLSHHLRTYLAVGGFPEVQGLPEALRVRVLQDYIDAVLLRDVVERHGVSNLPALRWFVRRLLAAPGGRFTINRLYNDLRAQGLTVSKDTLHAYLDHLEEACLLFIVPVHTASAQVRAVHARKAYVVDPGLAAACSYRVSKDVGHLLENTVYLELRRRGRDVAYVETASGREVDFVTTWRGEVVELVQVCADMTAPDTRARELTALGEAMAGLGLRQATIVTLEETDTLAIPAGTVRVVPAWRWLLEREQAQEEVAQLGR